jgi:hypothetical protein
VTAKLTISIVTILVLSMVVVTELVNAIEQPGFELVDQVGQLQIRKYQPHIVARTLVTGSFSESGSQGFRRLAGYIFGGNGQDQEIAMTAPVGLQSHDETSSDSRYWITFSMPSEYSVDKLPAPDDSRVDIVEVPERYLAVLRYRGNWSEERYRAHEAQLLSLIDKDPSWVKQGKSSWSRYDPPIVPSFMRTNEVAIEVSLAAQAQD